MEAYKQTNQELSQKIKSLLLQNPGFSVKEIAQACNLNRQFIAGFLRAMEEQNQLCSRKVGPARIYFIYEPRLTKNGNKTKI